MRHRHHRSSCVNHERDAQAFYEWEMTMMQVLMYSVVAVALAAPFVVRFLEWQIEGV